MISFNLKCENEHEFEGWFKDSASFEKQQELGLLECSICGSNNVKKALSAPNISTSRSQQKSQIEFFTKARNAMVQMRKDIESNCENVGNKFAEEARKIHYGEKEERGIYGNASADEVKELVEEGVEVAAVPWIDDQTN
ncbi:DUF1178 family protein [Curvivirga aplysinae]|uniref:DUF1178 family protein n=1 Tax=Curvivirga aplysinae TaxID=2529852 RepID=UPI0012BD530A|nr:DUF1178 family protein [Curvivirga aplysinae]MTI08657.1 DUF1178 family protein [Curvivirga aplysinae]